MSNEPREPHRLPTLTEVVPMAPPPAAPAPPVVPPPAPAATVAAAPAPLPAHAELVQGWGQA